jgi:hypothetical protein
VYTRVVTCVAEIYLQPNKKLTDRLLSLGEGNAGADGLVNDELAGLGVPGEPGPAGAEGSVASGLELLPELIEGAEVLQRHRDMNMKGMKEAIMCHYGSKPSHQKNRDPGKYFIIETHTMETSWLANTGKSAGC